VIETPCAETPFSLEEEAYWELEEEVRGACSEAARTILAQAGGAAWGEFMFNYYVEEPEEPTKHLDVITDEMRFAAAGLPRRDFKPLEELAHAALLVAASIHPLANCHTWPEYDGHRPNPHHYYRLLSGLLWGIVNEERIERW
jgi:hypothetical protein